MQPPPPPPWGRAPGYNEPSGPRRRKQGRGPSSAARPEKKPTDLPLAGPDQAQSLRLSHSRYTAFRRDPRRRRARHPSCYLRQAPTPTAHRRLSHRQTHCGV